MKYEPVSTDLRFVEREKRIRQFWEENQIFEKSVEERAQCPCYTFYDGPPTANGKPHIGHVITRVIKDMIPRYRTMKGYMVPRKAGWDTHGLPVELEVEKLLGLDGKEQIEQYGLEPFLTQCKESVWKYRSMWEDFSGTVGFWADMERPYVTYENSYIESEWWALKQIWEKGLLYKGFKIVPYCPRCGTPLSSHEVAQGYKDVKERSAIAKFRVMGEEASFLAWTTTPWTLPSNVALCVNARESYVKARSGEEVYYLAEALADQVLGEGQYTVLGRFTGKELEFKEYEPLFRFVEPKERCWYVTCADYVTLEDGTGIVHIAPAFGEDDSLVGRQYGLPFVQLVDSKGEMTQETAWAGVFCKKADPLVLSDLKQRGLLFSAPVFEHSYPHCWRCDTPLIYYARDSWFIRMTAVREQLIRNNDTVNWIPESIGKGRFGNWLENVQDWGISRNRYWGTPLNVWECGCGHRHAVGSIEELRRMSPDCPAGIELHRPFIDAVLLTCPQCGGVMKRVPEVVDCWFDSGAMPFAQHHYPFENEALFRQQFPADFISEAVDQTRGWFYSLLAISTLLFDCAPFKNVIVLGHVQDENGQKMSKSKGNAVDPFDALETYGADAIRWYFYTNSAPWLPSRFHGKAVVEGQRKFMGTLWNTYAFYVLYANIDGFDPTQHVPDPASLAVLDRWILSKLGSMVRSMDAHLQGYRIPEAARALQEFTDDLSNWYVRRSRERFWVQGLPPDKVSAYLTLYTCLVTLSKAAAPMIPFMAESIYQNLVCGLDKAAPMSVHLCAFPDADAFRVDEQLERDMDTVLSIVVLGRAARNAANIKNRQPLARMIVKADALDAFYTAIIEDELNLKAVEYTDDASAFTSYSFKPQLKTLGPRFGKKLGELRAVLAALDGSAAKRALDADGVLEIELSGETERLAPEDLLIEMVKSDRFVSVEDRGVLVALDVTLTDALLEEGFVRELISKIQQMRKEASFEVMDHIRVWVRSGEKIRAILEANRDQTMRETLADAIVHTDMSGYTKQWDINGEDVTLGVERV